MGVVIIAGQRFGRLRVTAFVERKRSENFYRCQCECGNERIVRGSSLRNGNTKSCGCFSRELMRELGKANRTHGQSHGGGKWHELPVSVRQGLIQDAAAKGYQDNRGGWGRQNRRVKAERANLSKAIKAAKRKAAKPKAARSKPAYRDDLPWLKH